MATPTNGVDLADPRQLGVVRGIFWGRFAHRVLSRGLDPHDCLQRVYLGILARNKGTRPFDPELGSLSNYAYIVSRSVTANFLDYHRRADRRLGAVGADSDAATWAQAHEDAVAGE